jgi:hypothetical protein
MKKKYLAVPPNVENLPLWLISDGKRGIKETKETVEPGQDGHEIVINRFLDERHKRVEDEKHPNGKLSHGSYVSDLGELALFKAYCKKADPAITTIQEAFSEANLDAFKVWIATHSTKVRPEGFLRKPKSIWHVVKKIKYMIEWAHSKRLIDEMPRNLKAFGLVILPQPNAITYEADELVALYRKARGAFQLYILLAINCGYTQIDIATLERKMVDFTTGISYGP